MCDFLLPLKHTLVSPDEGGWNSKEWPVYCHLLFKYEIYMYALQTPMFWPPLINPIFYCSIIVSFFVVCSDAGKSTIGGQVL